MTKKSKCKTVCHVLISGSTQDISLGGSGINIARLFMIHYDNSGWERHRAFALKDIESLYWIRLLHATEFVD